MELPAPHDSKVPRIASEAELRGGSQDIEKMKIVDEPSTEHH